MCGIFGLVTKEDSTLNAKVLQHTIDKLFKLSESRGKESSGLAILKNDSILVYKHNKPASSLIKEPGYQKLFDGYRDDNYSEGHSICLIGHTRLVTNGSMGLHDNNQPIITNGLVGIHNGIIVNDRDLWAKHQELKREYDVDTEVVLALLSSYLRDYPIEKATRFTFSEIQGSASLGILFADLNYLLLATNTGSLHYCKSVDSSVMIFASEKYILATLMKSKALREAFGCFSITQVKAGYGLTIELDDLSQNQFSLDIKAQKSTLQVKNRHSYKIVDELKSKSDKNKNDLIKKSLNMIFNPVIDDLQLETAIDSLKRCTRCILPETMPFIEFDENGVCNYCRNYKNNEIKGEAALEEVVASYRNKNGEPDSIVAFSGGRDSSYGLHYLKTVLKMNPIAYSYDWGMITDLGRRNQARMCGTLGVEHVLVSADINKKRQNIRQNIEAWFKRPHLGMIPLFMAGDKQYFYYANRLREQTGIELIVLCECPYEKTNFKSGYCGIKPQFEEASVYAIPIWSKIKMAGYYTSQFIRNPAYFNQSFFDSMSSFFSYYLMPHKFLKLYDFVKWDEQTIDSTLIPQYDWETANDTKSTWRIGDGTAPFYNYLYYNMAGFSENDTFRSNQIREGLMTREAAIKLVKTENKLREESFEVYCEIVGIDYKDTLQKIAMLPRLFNM